MKRLGLGALLALFAHAAVAQSPAIPDLDPVALCQKQMRMIAQGDWMTKACLEQEQRSYDQLKATWPTVAEKTRALCIKQARVVGLGYFLINACVEQELAAKGDVERFKFKK